MSLTFKIFTLTGAAGISPNVIRPNVRPVKNLAALMDDFKRLGININPSCRIGNSTLVKLVTFINSTLKRRRILSDFQTGIESGDRSNARRTAEELERSSQEGNFNITIGPHVVIGENVKLSPSVKIGERTKIGDSVEIEVGVVVDENCKIGKATHLHIGCKIGDNSEVVPNTEFKQDTIVPPNSLVVHESAESTVGQILHKPLPS